MTKVVVVIVVVVALILGSANAGYIYLMKLGGSSWNVCHDSERLVTS